jgi:hypothetical protein
MFGSGDADATSAVGPAEGSLTVMQAAFGVAPGMMGVLGLIDAWKLGLFLFYFIGRGDYRNTDIGAQMIRPYGRIVFLHIAIFAGAFALAALGAPIWGVAALALFKTAYDVLAEWRENRRDGGYLGPGAA